MVLGRNGVTSRSWRPGLGATWSGPGADPGPPYTREKLRVPVLTLANYRTVSPDWVGEAPTAADLDNIMQQMYTYRLCYWAGQCSPGQGPTSYETLPSGEETTTGLMDMVHPPGTVIQLDTFIDDQYTLPGGTSQDIAGGGTGPSGDSASSGGTSYTPAVGGGNVDVGGGQPAAAGMEIMGIPVLYLALGAGALFLVTQGKKGRF